jgi:hypothetical protein
MQMIDKCAVMKRCRRKITEGEWAVLNFVKEYEIEIKSADVDIINSKLPSDRLII